MYDFLSLFMCFLSCFFRDFSVGLFSRKFSIDPAPKINSATF